MELVFWCNSVKQQLEPTFSNVVLSILPYLQVHKRKKSLYMHTYTEIFKRMKPLKLVSDEYLLYHKFLYNIVSFCCSSNEISICSIRNATGG